MNVDVFLSLLQDLGELNTKQLVVSLTMALKATPRELHEEIIKAVVQKIRQSCPRQSMEYLYLLDSICKHMGADMIEILHQFGLTDSFIVDHFKFNSETALQEARRVVSTWTGPLFPDDLQGLDKMLQLVKLPSKVPSDTRQRKEISGDITRKTEKTVPLKGIDKIATTSNKGTQRLVTRSGSSRNRSGYDSNNQRPIDIPKSKPKDLPVKRTEPHTETELETKRTKIVESPLLDSAQLTQLLKQITVSSQRSSIPLHERLYGWTRQCTNCGLRFEDTTTGQSIHRAHMDSHFRRKARLRSVCIGASSSTKHKRILARDWFPTLQAWTDIDFSKIDTIHAGTNAIGTTASKASSQIKGIEGLEAYFSTGSGDGSNNKLGVEAVNSNRIPCGEWAPHNTLCCICHEPLKPAWDDDAEEWMFLGAVMNPHLNAPCHSTCL